MSRLALAFVLSLSAVPSFAQPKVMDFVPSNGASCVQTCAQIGGQAVSAGRLGVASSGDPNLYICKGAVPQNPEYGVRAGYNWTGAIGSNAQSGCTIVGAAVNSVQRFECLCQFNGGIRHL